LQLAAAADTLNPVFLVLFPSQTRTKPMPMPYRNERYRYTFLHKHIDKMMGATRLVRAVHELVMAAGSAYRPEDGTRWLADFFSEGPSDRRVWWPIQIDTGEEKLRDDLTCVLRSLALKGQPYALIVRARGAGSGKTVAAFKAFRDCVTCDPADPGCPLGQYVPLWIDREEAQRPPPGDDFAALVNSVNRTAGGLILRENTLLGLWTPGPPVLCFVNLPRPGQADRLAEDMIGAVGRAYARVLADQESRQTKVPHGFVLVCRSPKQEYRAARVLPGLINDCSLLYPSPGHRDGYLRNYPAFRCACLDTPWTPPEHRWRPSLAAAAVLGASPARLHAAALQATAPAERHPRSLAELTDFIVRDEIVRDEGPLPAQQWLRHSCVLFTRAALDMIAQGAAGDTQVTEQRLNSLLHDPVEFGPNWHPPPGSLLKNRSCYYRRYVDLLENEAVGLFRSLMWSAKLTAGGEVLWRFSDPSHRDFFAGVYALYWYLGPGVPGPSARGADWAREVVRWIGSSGPANWLGAAGYLADMLDAAELAHLLKALLKQGGPFCASLAQAILCSNRWERREWGPADALFKELARASARYEPFAWPETLIGLASNLVAHHPGLRKRGGPDLLGIFSEFKTAPPRPWLDSAFPVRVPEANSARIHRAPVIRLARLAGNTIVSLGGDGSLAWWNPGTGRLHTLEEGETPVTAFVAITNTKQVHYGQSNGAVRSWKLTSETRPLASKPGVLLQRAASAVRGLCVLNQGLLSVHADGTVLLCPLSGETQAQVRLVTRLTAEPTHVCPLTRDRAAGGDRAVVGDRTGHLHLVSADRHLASTERANKVAGAVRCLEALSDERFVSGHDSGIVRFWRIDGGNPPRLQAEGSAQRPGRSAVVRLLGVTDREAVAAHEDGTLSWQAPWQAPEGGHVLGRLPRAACGLAVKGRTLTASDGINAPRDFALPDNRTVARRDTGAVLLLNWQPEHSLEQEATLLLHGTREGDVFTVERPAGPADEAARPPRREGAGAAAASDPRCPLAAEFGFVGATGRGVIVTRRPGKDGWRMFDARRDRPGDTSEPMFSFRESLTCFCLGAEGFWTSLAGGRVLYWDRNDVPTVAADCRGEVLGLLPLANGVVVVDATGYVQWLGEARLPSGLLRHSFGRRPTAAAVVGRDLLLGDATGGLTVVSPADVPPPRQPFPVRPFAGPVRQLVCLKSSGCLAVAADSREARALCSGTGFPSGEKLITDKRVSAIGSFPIRLGPREEHLVVCGLADGGTTVSTVLLEETGPVVKGGSAAGRRHKEAVTAVAVRDPDTWATGAADGMVLLWRRRSPTKVSVETAFATYGCVAALNWFRVEGRPRQLFVGLRDGSWNVLTQVPGEGSTSNG
jgi:hypothetical protein